MARDGAAAHRRRRPREGEDARHPDLRRICRAVGDARQLLRQRLQQVRSRMAGADVGRADVPQSTRRHRCRLRALVQGRDDPAVVGRDRSLLVGAGRARPVQQFAVGEDHRPGRAGIQLGPGDCTRRADCARNAAERLQLRLGRHVVSGEEIQRRGDVLAGACRRHGVPDPRRPIRAARSGLSRQSGCAGSPTTSTSRSAS